MVARPGPAFGDLLRTYRLRVLWSQQQLARQCGLSVRTIRNLERGAVRPRADSVRLLADALGLSAAEAAELAREARRDAPLARQLPPDVPDFTGRGSEVTAIAHALDRPAAVPVVLLAGTPGVGKTALAVHVAHAIADRFPDGQLYADLRGAGPDPLDPATVLLRFLRALGLEAAEIPATADERATAYRSALAGRRVLVVLDDAGREAQVRPLLPGTAGCAVLITGRTRLPGLAGVRPVDVPVPDREQAVALLSEVAGRDRVAAEPDAARAIIERCGRLPLALRIAGARLAGRPRWSLDRLSRLLDDEAGRLDELAAGDLEVRASLALSYRSLPAPVRRAFRLLGVAGVGEFSPWLLAPLLDVPVAQAERLTAQLADACLLDPVTRAGTDRYRLHDLVRVYARECGDDEEPPARREAFVRLLGGWLALAELADQSLPTSSDVVTTGDTQRWSVPAAEAAEIISDPAGWFDLERDNLITAARAAAAADLTEPAWELAGTMVAWLLLRNDLGVHDSLYGPVTAACRRAGNARGVAAMAAIGHQPALAARNGTDAESELRSARACFAELGDARGEAATLVGLAMLTTDKPLQYRLSEEALVLARRYGDRIRELGALLTISRAAYELDRLPDSAAYCVEAIAIARSLGAEEVRASLLWRLGLIAAKDGRPREAIVVLEEAVTVTRRIGQRAGEAAVLLTLAETLLDLGRVAESRQHLEDALAAGPRQHSPFIRTHLGPLQTRLALAERVRVS